MMPEKMNDMEDYSVAYKVPINSGKRRSIGPFLRLGLELMGAFAVVLCWKSLRDNLYPPGSLLQDTLRPTKLCFSPVKAEGANDTFDWNALKPSEELSWSTCYGSKRCARLIVPLDYLKPKKDMAIIAMLKIPSAYASEHEKYRGPLLFNPGGPGGSGVDFILRSGDKFVKILGDEWDLIGFDPRGIGHTTPSFSFFKTEAEGVEWELLSGPLPNSTVDALARELQRADIGARLAIEKDRPVKAGRHMSTTVVARDMLQITRAHGREKLSYWGFSYGTILGATYAAMFPDNVGRLVIDGVVDAVNYYATLWSNNLRDTEKGLQIFFDACSTAKPADCLLHQDTPEQVEARFDAILRSIKKQPISVRGAPNSSDYGVVDYKIVKEATFNALYSPYDKYTVLAEALAALEKGDGAPMLKFMPPKHLACHCSGSSQQNFGFPGDLSPGKGVMCTDGRPVRLSLEDAEVHLESLAKDSPRFADIWSQIRIGCNNWNLTAASTYTGDFVANTSFPLLLVGNTADPVTPLAFAHKMSIGFKGSVVLTQNSPGHCSIASASLCTQKAIRSYFNDGKLPSPGTTCEVEDELFSKSTHLGMGAFSVEDAELVSAVRELRSSFSPRLGI